MNAHRILLVAACIPSLLTSASALDATPFPSFAYEGQQIRQAVITGVDTNGVTLIGKDAKGEERSLLIPLLAAQKMVLLNSKAKDEIEAALEQQRSAEAAKRIAEYRRKNAGKEVAFDLHEKTPQGWVGVLCVRPDNWRGRKDDWNTGDQMVLVRCYGKAMAEGERIITRAEEKGTTEVDVGGHPRTLRVYEVVGDDRLASVPATQPPQTTEPQPPAERVPDEGVVSASQPELNGANLTIIEATYGAGSHQRDVKELLKHKIVNGKLSTRADNAEMGGDPIFGQVKELRVKYNGPTGMKEVSFSEGEGVELP